MRVCMYYGYDVGKNREASCRVYIFFQKHAHLQDDLFTIFNDLFYNYIFYNRQADKGFATSRLRSEEDGISTIIII